LPETAVRTRREQAHVTGKADEIDFVIEKSRDNFAVVFRAGLPFEGMAIALRPRWRAVSSPGASGDSRSRRRCGHWYRAGRNAVGDGDEVGAASGEENAEVFHGTQ